MKTREEEEVEKHNGGDDLEEIEKYWSAEPSPDSAVAHSGRTDPEPESQLDLRYQPSPRPIVPLVLVSSRLVMSYDLRLCLTLPFRYFPLNERPFSTFFYVIQERLISWESYIILRLNGDQEVNVPFI